MINEKLKRGFILNAIHAVPKEDFKKAYFIIEETVNHLMNVLASKTDFEESIATGDENLNKLSLGNSPSKGIEFGVRIIIQPDPGDNLMRVDLFYMPDMVLTEELKITDIGCSPSGKY